MSDKIRPGMSIHINIIIFLFVVVVLTLLANYLVKVDPDYNNALELAKDIHDATGVDDIRVVMRGRRTGPPAERTIKISLYLSAAEWDAEMERKNLCKTAADVAMGNHTLPAGTVIVVAKKPLAGGCHPTFTEAQELYSNPAYRIDTPAMTTKKPPQKPAVK